MFGRHSNMLCLLVKRQHLWNQQCKRFEYKGSWLIVSMLPTLLHVLDVISHTATCLFSKVGSLMHSECSHVWEWSAAHEHVVSSPVHNLRKTSCTNHMLTCDVFPILWTYPVGNFCQFPFLFHQKFDDENTLLHLQWQGVMLSCTASNAKMWRIRLCVREWDQCSHHLPWRVFHHSCADIFCKRKFRSTLSHPHT